MKTSFLSLMSICLRFECQWIYILWIPSLLILEGKQEGLVQNSPTQSRRTRLLARSFIVCEQLQEQLFFSPRLLFTFHQRRKWLRATFRTSNTHIFLMREREEEKRETEKRERKKRERLDCIKTLSIPSFSISSSCQWREVSSQVGKHSSAEQTQKNTREFHPFLVMSERERE